MSRQVAPIKRANIRTRCRSAAIAPKLSRTDLLAETKIHQVVVLHNVLFGLQAQLARPFGLGLTAGGAEVGKADDLGANETLLQVRVNRAGCLPRRRAGANRPGTVLLAANGQEADEACLVKGPQQNSVWSCQLLAIYYGDRFGGDETVG